MSPSSSGNRRSRNRKAWITRGLLLLGIVGAAVVVAPYLGSLMKAEEEFDQLTHIVRRGRLMVSVTENGMLESSNNKEIKCMVKGGSTVLSVIKTGTAVEPGDVLVRLDTSRIEDNITTQEIAYETALANKIITESDVAVAEKSITEYLEGTYIEEKSTIEKEIFDAEQEVKTAELQYQSSTRLASKGVINPLQLDGEKFAVDSARKQLELKQVKLKTLEQYKKEKEVQRLQSTLDAARARLASDEARLRLEETRLDREKEQLENCVIKAETAGMVIFPSMAEWKETPDIEEGATVREQQTLLMIPDLSQMQVKVGIHESKVGRLTEGMKAKIALQDLNLEGTVKEIATITKPAGWWTGNMVKYDTIIQLDAHEGLKPGMSATVDIILAEYSDVLLAPVAAILETEEGFECWVKSGSSVKRREIEIGDTNDEFIIIESGLEEGDEIVMNPLAFVDESKREKLKSGERGEGGGSSSKDDKGANQKGAKKAEGDSAKQDKKAASAPKLTGATLIKMADKNGDGSVTEDELPEKDRGNFSQIDANGDGKLDEQEMDVVAKMLSASSQEN